MIAETRRSTRGHCGRTSLIDIAQLSNVVHVCRIAVVFLACTSTAASAVVNTDRKVPIAGNDCRSLPSVANLTHQQVSGSRSKLPLREGNESFWWLGNDCRAIFQNSFACEKSSPSQVLPLAGPSPEFLRYEECFVFYRRISKFLEVFGVVRESNWLEQKWFQPVPGMIWGETLDGTGPSART